MIVSAPALIVRAASVLRVPRSARARATAGGTSPGRTNRRRGRSSVMVAGSRTGVPRVRLRERHDQRPRRAREPVAPLTVVAEHILARARRRQDDVAAGGGLDERERDRFL